MEQLAESPFQAALDMVERLPSDAQEALIEIVARRLVEQRRAEIGANARATLEALREGRARYGTVDDLRRDDRHGSERSHTTR
ncbi:MAG TPA: hypothetical protein PKO09_16620 [Anaerolineae bacterium]|nr:hypothetical protein [Anaerolineae bacterium]